MGLEKKADEIIDSPGPEATEMVIQDLMDRDERIDRLLAILERKYDRGNELQSRLEMLSSKMKEKSKEDYFPFWQRSGLQEAIDEANQELEQLSNEVDDLNSQLVDLSFNQGQIKRELRHGAGMLGSSQNPYDIHGDVDVIEKDLGSDRRQPSWNVENIFEPSYLEVAQAALVKDLVSISNELDQKGLIKEADVVDRVINNIILE